MNENKELVLVSNLRKNCRETLTKMSRSTGIPVSTLFDMLRKTDKIRKHTCIPYFSKLGYGVKAFMSIAVETDHKSEVKAYLLSHPNLNSLFKINNGFDYMAEIICRSLHDLETISETINEKYNITKKEVHYVIEDIAREEFFSNSALWDSDFMHEQSGV